MKYIALLISLSITSPIPGMQRIQNFLQGGPQATLEEIRNAPRCIICLENLDTNEPLKILECSPGHKHIFHRDCVYLWLQNQHTCPLCRAPIDFSFIEKMQKQLSELNPALRDNFFFLSFAYIMTYSYRTILTDPELFNSFLNIATILFFIFNRMDQ